MSAAIRPCGFMANTCGLPALRPVRPMRPLRPVRPLRPERPLLLGSGSVRAVRAVPIRLTPARRAVHCPDGRR
eukprot:10324393-Heterocapsa_arctica.AAC.1